MNILLVSHVAQLRRWEMSTEFSRGSERSKTYVDGGFTKLSPKLLGVSFVFGFI